jgi:tRNA uridine 5-carbamoylmethylation protein Kti12
VINKGMANQLTPKTAASVCCMVGLPGCGKSTVARTLRGLLKNHNNNNEYVEPLFGEIVIIDYDAIAQQELGEQNSNNDGDEDTSLDPDRTSFDSNELAAWRKGRVTAIEILKDTLVTHFTGGGNASTLLILLDDNFHLRSMRRDIYRSCQDIVKIIPQAKIGFSVVYFTTPLELCLQRNNMRSGNDRVPQDVINRMASIIEPPEETKPAASFEHFHVSIENADDTFDMNMTGHKLSNEIYPCLLSSLESPILPKNELSEDQIAQLQHQRILQREETLKCEIQRIDQLLRKLVGAVGRVDKKRSREANVLRRSILEMIRQDNDVVKMEHDCIVQHFACSMLGTEFNSDWLYLDNALVLSIKEAYQEVTHSIPTGT